MTGAGQERTPPPLVVTLAHPRELGQVRALWFSLRRFHPLGRMYVLWLAPPPAWADRADQPIGLHPADIGVRRARFLAFAHEPAAYRAVLRPRLLEFMLASGRAPSHVVCIDPGLVLGAPLDGLVRLAARSSAVLGQRARGDDPDDGRRPPDAGAVEDRVMALGSGPGSRALVAWWVRRAAEDPSARWLDLAPALFPDVALRWQSPLQSARPQVGRGWRLLGSVREEYSDGVPIAPAERAFLRAGDPEGARFPDPFRAEGADAFRAWAREPADQLLHPGVPTPTRLGEWLLTSGALGERTRERWPDHRFAHRRDLCAWLRRNGRDALGIGPDRLVLSVPDREAWAPLVARELPLAARAGPGRPPKELVETACGDPAELLQDPSLHRWLAEPADRRYPPMPRGAMCLYAASPEIWREFPAPLEGDRDRFARWCVAEGARWRLPAALVEAVSEALAVPLDRFGAVERLREWARAPVDDRWPSIPRVALALRERWPAVMARFPDPLGADRMAFARWFVGECAARVYLPPTATVRTRATMRLVATAS